MPYWRLSGFYLFYFAALGALVPYWGLYLRFQGFDAIAIGELIAILMATKIVAPNIWGWIADHTGRRMAIVRLASLLSVIVFCGVFFAQGFWPLALVMVLFSFFWNASLPQLEAVTFSHLGRKVHYYSRIRLWGSIGFIVAVVLVGWALDIRDPSLVPYVVLVFYFGIWLFSLLVPERLQEPHPQSEGSLTAVLKRPEILAFLAVCFLMQASHGAYYAFYSIYLKEHDYSSSLIGQLWALGVVAEVLVFLVMHRLLHRFGARIVLLSSLFVAVVRWALIGHFPDALWVMLVAQIFHAATFGTFHAAAIHLVHHYFRGRHQGRGQALYSSLSFGAGGALGSLASGFLWDASGPVVTYNIAAALACFALLVTWRWVRDGPGDGGAPPDPEASEKG